MKKIFSPLLFLLLLFLTFGLQDQKDERVLLNEQYIGALRLIGQEQYDKALNELKNIIRKDSHFAKAYKKIVSVYRLRTELDSAKEYFEKLIQENNQNPGALYGLGLYYYEKNDFTTALEYMQKAIKLNSRAPAFYTCLVNSSKRINTLDAAEKYLTSIIENEPDNAAANYGMGLIHYNRQQWDETKTSIDAALKLDPDMLKACLLECDLYLALNKYQELLELAPDKVKLCENRDIDLQIDFLTRISKAHSVLGRYQEALEADKKALDLARDIGNKKSEGTLLGNIGVFYANTGELQKALDYFHQKLAIVREIGDREGESHILMNIGAVTDWMGNYKDSLKFYKQALDLNEELDNLENRGLLLGNIGTAYEKLSEYNRALDYHRQALEIFQKIKNKRYSAWVYMNIGALIYKLGMQDEALENLFNALQITQEVGEKASEGMILGFIGSIYNNPDGLDKSREYLTKALDIAREIGDQRTEIMHLGNLGTVYLELKDYKKADEVLTQGLKLAEKVGDTLTETELLVISGILYREMEEHEKSIECFQKTLSKGKDIDNPRIIWNSEWGMALTHEKMKKYKEAITHYRNSIDVIESIRGKLQSAEQKAGFLKEKIKIYEGLINLLFRQSDEDPGGSSIQESFHVAERARSRAFLDLLAEAEVTVASGLAEELRQEEADLQARLTDIQQKLLNPELKEEERKGIYRELQSIESDYNDFVLKIRANSPKYASLIYPVPYSLEKAQKELLDERTYIIEFFVGEDNSFMWLISQDDILWSKSFPSSEALFDKIISYQTQISRRKLNLDFKLGKELFDTLLKDALEQVPTNSNLIFIPDGILLRFPFEALVLETKNGIPRYLLEDYTLTYGPSASVLGEIKNFQGVGAAESIELLALGNPAIEGKEGNATVEYIRSSGVSLLDLPFAEEEVSAISKIYEDKGRETEVYTKDKASEEVLKSGEMGAYRSLHFATHGFIDDRVPALSGILLAPSEDPEGDDGFLRLNEIFNLRLNADLVTLSACETALGKEVKGEGMIGLTRAFFYAGTRSIVASLWMVSDQSTSELMTEFYSNLVEGVNPKEALRLAKVNLLKGENPLYKHPFFWAPFIYLGAATNN